MPLVRTVRSSEVADAFKGWLDQQASAGVALVIVDGLPGAGKSTLASKLGDMVIDLDTFLPSIETDGLTSWIDLVIAGGAIDFVRERLKRQSMLVVCGAAASPVIEQISNEICESEMRRTYLRRVAQINGHTSWLDGLGLIEHAENSLPYFRAIYGFHGHQKPWETADMVLERIEEHYCDRGPT